MDRFKKVFKWWFAWDSEKVEEFLECMSLQGWHTVHAGGLLVHFLFERGEPRHIRYCMDYQREEKHEYMQIFTDSGWTLLQKSMGWYLWSHEYTGERPDIYTDADSLIRRNRSLLSLMLMLLVTQVPLLVANAVNLAQTAQTSPTAFVVLVSVLAAIYALLVYCIVRLAASNRKLKKRKA